MRYQQGRTSPIVIWAAKRVLACASAVVSTGVATGSLYRACGAPHSVQPRVCQPSSHIKSCRIATTACLDARFRVFAGRLLYASL